MPTCDICSLTIEKSEMHLVSGPDISNATNAGFFPKDIAKHSPMAAFSDIFGGPSASDPSSWRMTVKGNQTADWGLCQTCLKEFQAFQKERKRREEEQRIEAKRRAAERAAEEARRKPIMEERVQNRQCRYCGSALGFFDKIFKRTNHKKCREQNGTF
ncbi:MAG: hypothetical protein KDN04_10450 [Verrucomicrobiae bacterium]|nr:hypothetical protein [Verrucomicrobiae bacterium]